MRVNKDVTICFRTSSRVQASLKAAAAKENTSISALLDSMLAEFLRGKSGTDKRRHSRKDASIPVIINGVTPTGPVLLTGTIQDLSLGGVRIALPDQENATLVVNAGIKDFEIMFKLPDGSTRPVSMTCKPARVQQENGEVLVGASFHDGDLQSYFEIQNYLA